MNTQEQQTEAQHLEAVNLAEKFEKFGAHWSPKIVGELNDFHVKLVKVQGEFVWHHHEVEDELFLVVQGRLLMRFRNREVWVEESEFIIVPHGIEHCPSADAECHILLLEPKTTVNTGTERSERTAELEWIWEEHPVIKQDHDGYTKIGDVLVSTGVVVLGDPIVLLAIGPDDKVGSSRPTFGDGLGAVSESQPAGALLTALGIDVGIAFRTGYGDGNYPVYAKFDDKHCIVEVLIDMHIKLSD